LIFLPAIGIKPTHHTLLKLLERKKLGQLAQELTDGTTTFKEFFKPTEAQWKDLYGAPGVHIFNHLHTPEEGMGID
jgi:hypothetical protein